MLIALHKNARTTPAVRAEIAASNEPASVLAQRFGITEQTVYKWKKRSVFADRSHTAHRLQTVLTPAQETVVVHLRRTLLLPLDDLLAVTREFICPNVSRSGLDRCLRRHGAGNLNALKPREPAVAHKAFKSYEPGYVHMDVKYLPQMQDESQRRYLFVAIDRATRWVFVQFKANKTAASARAFLKALHKACPIRINKLLTDNGKEFTDRLFASREREPSGHHEFDQLCQELGIEHRLTKPRTPRTNGMVERFNGRIADVLKTHRFNSREDMEQTLLRYVALYNHQLPQSALKSSTPMQAMKEWYQTHPHLFHKRPYDRPGCDTYATILAGPAAVLQPGISPRLIRGADDEDEFSVFNYLDTASSRVGLGALASKLENEVVGILGAGGTGGYILDLVAKTPVKEIRLFDDDEFLLHNAFRAPGAPSLEELRDAPKKVHYLRGIYERMHRGIVAHPVKLKAETLGLLDGITFAFISMDAGEEKRAVVAKLEALGVSFIDVGMGLELSSNGSLGGILRVTTSTPAKRDHIHAGRISFEGGGGQDVYASNIQVADLNALNACLAVVRWKKLRGFYRDLENEHHSTYTTDGGMLLNGDQS